MKSTPSDQDLIVTPGGPRRKDLVHPVRPGDAVCFDSAGVGFVTSQEEASIIPAPRSSSMADTVLTPGGYRPRSLVHRVGPRHALFAAGGRMLMINLATDGLVDVPKVSVPSNAIPTLGGGWITYAFWNNGTGTPISSFATTWQVPPAPTTPGNQTIFLFNGIENFGANYGILQPVLQWGPSAAGGGAYWSIASWYVTSGGEAFFTPLIPVNPGDTLIGLMTLKGHTGNLFNYECEFKGIAGTNLAVNNIAELLWCNETLETYETNQCSDYPNTDFTALSAINIQTASAIPPLNWTPVDRVTDCGQHAKVISNSATAGQVDIYYRTPGGP